MCGDKGSQGAHCKNTLTSETRDIPKAQWDQERVGQICVGSAGIANWKEAIEILCRRTKSCDYETKEELRVFFQNLEEVQKSAVLSE